MNILRSVCLGFYLLLALTGLVQSSVELLVEIPKPPIKGIRFSFAHESGITQVEFHLSFTKQLKQNDPGEFSKIIVEPLNGRWTYDIKDVYVPKGKQIHIWVKINYFNPDENVEQSILITCTKSEGEIKTIHVGNSKDIKKKQSEVRRTMVNGELISKNTIIFEDNFDNINWTKWSREVRIPLSGDDGDFVSFQRRPENLYVRNGQLHIIPSLLSNVSEFDENSILHGKLDLGETCTGIIDPEEECSKDAQHSQILPPIVSARATTRHSFSFRYGRVEIRAKLPKGDWIFPLILLEPLENYYGSTGYASGQLRVASIRGNEYLTNSSYDDISGKRLNNGVVLGTGESFHQNCEGQLLGNSHLGEDFHNYTLVWSEKSITFKIDGIKYHSIHGRLSSSAQESKTTYKRRWDISNNMAPFDREFYLTLGVSVGGHSEFPDGCHNKYGEEKPWNNLDPKALYSFWMDRANWLETWKGPEAGLHIDFIKVYAI